MYRDDLEAALARVGSLERENAKLRGQLAGKIPVVIKMPNGEDMVWVPAREPGQSHAWARSIGPFNATGDTATAQLHLKTHGKPT